MPWWNGMGTRLKSLMADELVGQWDSDEESRIN